MTAKAPCRHANVALSEDSNAIDIMLDENIPLAALLPDDNAVPPLAPVKPTGAAMIYPEFDEEDGDDDWTNHFMAHLPVALDEEWNVSELDVDSNDGSPARKKQRTSSFSLFAFDNEDMDEEDDDHVPISKNNKK